MFGAPIELDELAIDPCLVERIEPRERRGNYFVDATHRFGDAFAAVTFLVAIAQFPRFMLAGAGATRNRRASERASLEVDIDFDGRVAARIKNLARADFANAGFRHKKVRDLPR